MFKKDATEHEDKYVPYDGSTDDLSKEAGLFELIKDDVFNINYYGKTQVSILKPCDYHSDGAKPEKYENFSDKEGVFFILEQKLNDHSFARNRKLKDIPYVKEYTKDNVITEQKNKILGGDLTERLEVKYLKTIHALTLALAKKTNNLLTDQKKELSNQNIKYSAVETVIQEHCQTISEPRKIITKALKTPFNNPKVKI